MSDTPALLPCPFCGDQPRFVDDDSYGACQVFCPNEYNGCPGPGVHMEKDKATEAFAQWNRRTPIDVAPVIAALEAASVFINCSDRELDDMGINRGDALRKFHELHAIAVPPI